MAGILEEVFKKLTLENVSSEITAVINRANLAQVLSQGERSGSKYIPLTKRTIRDRIRQGYNMSPILVRKGTLLKSISTENTLLSNGGRRLEIEYPDSEIAAYSQIGNSKLAQRKSVDLQQRDVNEIAALILKSIQFK